MAAPTQPVWDESQSRWVHGPVIAYVVDNTGGAADGTLQVIGAVYSQAEVRNNFADLAAKVNAILAALRTAGISAD